jgi:hypothetical protein
MPAAGGAGAAAAAPTLTVPGLPLALPLTGLGEGGEEAIFETPESAVVVSTDADAPPLSAELLGTSPPAPPVVPLAPPPTPRVGHGGSGALLAGAPPGSCPGTTLSPLAGLSDAPRDARPTIQKLFASLHGVGEVGACAVSGVSAFMGWGLLPCAGARAGAPPKPHNP